MLEVRRENRLVGPIIAIREGSGGRYSPPKLGWRVSVEPIQQRGMVPNECVGLEIVPVRCRLRYRGLSMSGRSA
jgi:hypothetical protein